MNISIFGLGYVGVVGMGCLARLGHQVIGVDVSSNKVDLINQGKSPVVESEIDEIIREQWEKGAISATHDANQAIQSSEVSFICVGTPSTTNGHLDLDAVYRVAQQIGKGIKEKEEFHVIAIRSTVLPGTNKKVTDIIAEASGKVSNEGFAVVSNPEFLREGTAVKDYFDPPFTLLGSSSPEAIVKMEEVYRRIGAPVIATQVGVAELIKYVNNAFHALKITFANEVGNICSKIGIDSHELMRIFCMDTRLNLSPYYLKPGFAYGGSCLPKDLKALSTIAHDEYLRCPVLESIEPSNELQKEIVLTQILEFGKQKIGILGLSFKAGTDDLRNSPIIDVLERLLGKGFDVRIYDQNVHLSQLIGSNRQFILKRIPFISRFITSNIDEVLDHSEVVVVVNGEREFRDALSRMNSDKIIYDLVNLGLSDVQNRGNNYVGIAW